MTQQEAVARPPGVIALAVAASTCAHLLSLALPLALLQVYDRILPNKAYGTTVFLALGVSVAILLDALLRYGRAVLFAHAGAAFESQMTIRLLDHVMRADSKSVHALGTPALSDAMRAVGRVRDFWSGNAAAALHELPFVVIYIGLIAYIGSWLALVPLTTTVVALLAALLVVRMAVGAAQEVEVTEARRRDLVWGIFTGLSEVKAMAAETILTRRYRDAAALATQASVRGENCTALIRENGMLLAQLSTIGVLTFGVFKVLSGELTTGGLAACTLLAGRSIGPGMSAFAYLGRLAFRRQAEHSIDQVLSLPQAPLWAGGEGGKDIFAGGSVDLSGTVLRDGPVTIPAGSVVRVEAPDTLTATAALDAIAQIDRALDLRVTFDGKSCPDFDRQSLRERIASAGARTPLIPGSLLDNLTFFSPQHDAEAIQLTQRLGLEKFVDGLHQGIMTQVGAAGAEIASPGIVVRIGLIRALVRKPAVLCLDEVGQALDLDGMRRLTEVLKELKGRVTIFLASHNPALLQLTDRTVHIERRPAA